jgi:hypothetical protein
MDWKTLLAYITGTVDQELLVRNEYLVTENRIPYGQNIRTRCALDSYQPSLGQIQSTRPAIIVDVKQKLQRIGKKRYFATTAVQTT